MEIPIATPKALLADKGYDGDRFRESLLIRGILPIIPPRANRKVPEHPAKLHGQPGPRSVQSESI
jgi:IS5 family transposase